MAWTNHEDVEARWVASDERRASTQTIQAWIEDAETVIRHEFPDIAERIDGDPELLGRVKLVVCSMVLRVLRNPDNARTINTGPFAKTFAGDTPGGLWLTDEERELLASSAAMGAAFTIEPARPEPPPPTAWGGPYLGPEHFQYGWPGTP